MFFRQLMIAQAVRGQIPLVLDIQSTQWTRTFTTQWKVRLGISVLQEMKVRDHWIFIECFFSIK